MLYQIDTQLCGTSKKWVIGAVLCCCLVNCLLKEYTQPMKFEEFNLHEDIMRGINDAGFDEAMPAQERTFQAVLSGKDVTVQSQTGTGKTAAFLISIYQLFQTDAVKLKKALIVVPTRELAVQIEEEADMLGKYLPYKTVSIYGGVGYKQQLDKLKNGADFIVGTPGRLLDLEKSNHIDYKTFGILVIDEADRLFDMGFFPDLRKMLRKLAPREERRTMLFSATLNTRVLNLAWDQMNEYEEIKIEPEKVTVEEIEQQLYHVAGHEKFRLLLGVLKKQKFENAIVFCNTKNKVAEVAKRLEVNGYKTRFLMGDLPQKKRLEVINKMKAGELDILVATDVAARGLHVDDLSLVVNYDLPEDFENYVHRIGRTARAGKSGRAVSLACEKYVYHLPAIENYIGDKISVMIADEDIFAEDASAGMNFRNSYDDRSDRDRSGRRDGSRGNGSRDGRRGGSRDGNHSGGRSEYRSENRGDGRSDNRGGSRDGSRNGSRDGERSRRPEGAGIGAQADRGGRNGQRRDGQRSDGLRREGQRRDGQQRDGGYKKTAKAPQDLKRPTSASSAEDRIAYYKAKYGEDFKPSGDMKTQGSSGGSGKRKSVKNYGNRNNNQNKPQNAPGKKQFQSGTPKPVNAADSKAAEASKTGTEKKGFFSRLFGKK